MAGCLLVGDLFWSSLLGVTAFSCFWSIGEVKQQEKRVRKGGFRAIPGASTLGTASKKATD